MLALSRCAARGVEFAQAFRYQYVIARRKVDAPGFAYRAFARHHVYTGPALPVTQLQDRNGLAVGLLLGRAADAEGLLPATRRIDAFATTEDEPFDRLERWLDDLSGRWTLIAAIGEEVRLYSDPTGMNGVVYNRQLRRVAASLTLCLDDEVQLNPDYKHAQIETEGAKYTLFDTRDVRVRRMNPSCYLDLRSFAETRFWPRPETFAAPASLAAHYDEIIATAQARIAAFATGAACVLPLSGGRDSRLIAGFAGPAAFAMAEVYSHVTKYATRRDAVIAGEVAATLGLRHKVLDLRQTRHPQADLDRLRDSFQVALGYDANPPDEYRLGIVLDLPEDAVMLRGHQTDILRAVYGDYRTPEGRADLGWQIRRLKPVPYHCCGPKVVRRFGGRYQAWIDTLPETARDRQADLMFLEIYYPSSIGASFPALYRNFYLSPFNCRRLVGMAMAIDEDYRREAWPVTDMLYRMNPGLHDIPFDNEMPASMDSFANPAARAALVADRRAATLARAGTLGEGLTGPRAPLALAKRG